MGRPRADGAAAKPSTAPPSKPRLASPPSNRSTGTGIVGGSGVAAIAQLLPPPYKTILSIIAPTLSVAIAAWGPKVLDIVAFGIEQADTGCRHWFILYRHRNYLKKQRKKLQDRDLFLNPPESRSFCDGLPCCPG